jgi:hypothetical protein
VPLTEDIAIEPKNNNGVPRSSWYRPVRRVSTWHRPYAIALVAVDLLATALARFTAISVFEQSRAGFQHAPGLFAVIAYVLLPLGWLVVLWSHGAYDRRYLGVGTDEFKRVFRAAITVAASVSFLAFALKLDLSNFGGGSGEVDSCECRYGIRHRLGGRVFPDRREAGNPLLREERRRLLVHR